MDREPIIQVPGVVPFQWTVEGYIAAVDAALVKHSHLEMFEGIVIIDVWAPHGKVPEGSPGVDPYRWDVDEFLAILDAGLIDDPHRVELLDGIMAVKEPPRDAAWALSPSETLLKEPRVVLGHRSVCLPEYVLVRPEAAGSPSPVWERDVLWALDIEDSSFDRELSPRTNAYARAGVPSYSVHDVERHGVWTFSRSEGGIYREESFASEGEPFDIPFLGETFEPSKLLLDPDQGTRSL